ncbi:hypothetical protein COV20_03310 [Candidatus Woesearchaeota archaeon CG10_big_fil_rev_8_21_14_0_10_45_16]|nr:MAG: hypothetical protein COV20_03310 [Candidatus Woesearchaeota archaeon CG10_big_fil_rev_8_21_14_0_10_45_16]
MALYLQRLILEIPSVDALASLSSEGATLEQALIRDFGREALERFRGYGIELDTPVNTGYTLRFDARDMLVRERNNAIAKFYALAGDEIKGVYITGAEVKAIRSGRHWSLLALMDLTPVVEDGKEAIKKFLRMKFPLQD